MCPSVAMSAAVLAMPSWRVDALRAETLASKVSASVRNQANILRVASNLWTLDGRLRDFLEKFYKQVEKGTPSVTPPTEEGLQSALKSLRSITDSIEEMYNRGKAGGLTNRRFVGAALNSVRMRSEELRDIVESVELSMTPETDAIFDKALAALRAGDVVDLAQLT
jgi:hypothetical protein